MTLTFKTFWKRLRDKENREELVIAHLKRGVSLQIRALMRQRQLSQQELAQRSKLTQGVISRAANPNVSGLTLMTIGRVAAGFDMAFVGKFVPFSDLARWYDQLADEELADVSTFIEEDHELAPLVDDEPLVEAAELPSPDGRAIYMDMDEGAQTSANVVEQDDSPDQVKNTSSRSSLKAA